MSPFGLKFSQMILHTETSKLVYNWSFLFEVLHKPTLLPSTFKLFLKMFNIINFRWTLKEKIALYLKQNAILISSIRIRCNGQLQSWASDKPGRNKQPIWLINFSWKMDSFIVILSVNVINNTPLGKLIQCYHAISKNFYCTSSDDQTFF